MKQLNVGIIGVGWPGQQHAKAIAVLPNTRLHSCADNDPARLDAFVKEYGPGFVFSDYRDLLHDPELEAAIVCLPNFLHFPASLAALEEGKHVLCEKPPTMNAAEMKVLRDEAAKRNLIYFFGRQFRGFAGGLDLRCCGLYGALCGRVGLGVVVGFLGHNLQMLPGDCPGVSHLPGGRKKERATILASVFPA